MSATVRFKVERAIVMARYDTVYLSETAILEEQIAAGVVDSISTEIEVKLGDVTVHLAMLQNPDHWSDDWEKLGVEDVDEFLAGLIVRGDT